MPPGRFEKVLKIASIGFTGGIITDWKKWKDFTSYVLQLIK
jgi:hypothetical protein